MKRLIIVVLLSVFVILLVKAVPKSRDKQLVNAATASAMLPQDPCGGGCDPDGSMESACISSGGIWNSSACYCSFMSCDPTGTLEAECFFAGGTWNQTTCSCSLPQTCNPGPWIGTPANVTVDYSYCNPFTWTVYDVHGGWVDWRRYCQDGTLYDQYTQYTEASVNTGVPCGDGGRGGGGGGGGGGGYDCWYDLDCWCPNHKSDEDCEEYCWWNYCEDEEAD